MSAIFSALQIRLTPCAIRPALYRPTNMPKYSRAILTFCMETSRTYDNKKLQATGFTSAWLSNTQALVSPHHNSITNISMLTFM